MESKNYITLRAYAEKQGVEPATVRQKILRGKLKAQKIGRDWLIEETEPYTDHRRKANKEI